MEARELTYDQATRRVPDEGEMFQWLVIVGKRDYQLSYHLLHGITMRCASIGQSAQRPGAMAYPRGSPSYIS